jgi:hypothetical protein
MIRRSDSRSVEVGSNDGEGSQKGKKRRAESVETDDNAKKSRNPRKTAVACNFCRGELIILAWRGCQSLRDYFPFVFRTETAV